MNIISSAKQVARQISEHNYEVFFVGGFVRDTLLHRHIDDIDIVTNALTDELSSFLKIAHSVGKQFNVIVTIKNNFKFEVASFRQDCDYTDNRRPNEIKAGNIKEDALRRDFTINGMYFNPFTEEILDFHQGKRDLEFKIIRTIGDPHTRIKEDRLRILRCFRFAAVLHFSIEEKTLKATQSFSLFPWVSKERVREEFLKADKHSTLFNFIKLLGKHNILHQIFPSLTPSLSFFSEQTLSLPQISSLPTLLKLAFIFRNTDILSLSHHLSPTHLDKLMISLFSKLMQLTSQKASFFSIFAELKHPWCLNCLTLVLEATKETNKEYAEKMDNAVNINKANISHYMQKESPITGSMLKTMGIAPSPLYAKIIERSWKELIENNLTKDDIIANIKTIIDQEKALYTRAK